MKSAKEFLSTASDRAFFAMTFSAIFILVGTSAVGYRLGKKQQVQVVTPVVQEATTPSVSVDTAKFLWVMAVRESSLKWDAKNRLGYVGLFQFGRIALKDVGMGDKYEKYRDNPTLFRPDLQVKAMKQLMRNNTRYMKGYEKYVGKDIDGVKINWEGILAACHLVGNAEVKLYLDSRGNYIPVDGNKVKLTKYFELFSDNK
jgi:hypothetical protein